jgi:hypothetical protein
VKLSAVKIRIVREPPATIEDLNVGRYHLHSMYDVSARVANLLVMQGYAVFEKREHDLNIPPAKDRRRRKTR